MGCSVTLHLSLITPTTSRETTRACMPCQAISLSLTRFILSYPRCVRLVSYSLFSQAHFGVSRILKYRRPKSSGGRFSEKQGIQANSRPPHLLSNVIEGATFFPNGRMKIRVCSCLLHYFDISYEPFFPDNYTQLCTVITDLSKVPLSPSRGANGATFYRIDYDVVLLFGLTELKAQVAWKENGVEKR